MQSFPGKDSLERNLGRMRLSQSQELFSWSRSGLSQAENLTVDTFSFLFFFFFSVFILLRLITLRHIVVVFAIH